jgi:hypothetical protein
MAEKTPTPPVAPHDDQDLWLVSYSDDDDREMSALQIAAALTRGEIDANTIVWRDGMAEWKAIAEVDVLKEQLQKVASPENARKRSTVIGGFGPAQPFRGSTAAPPPAQLPLAAPAPGDMEDDDEPTVVQPAFAHGFGSSPNNATPGPAPSRSRHPTSGNTLRIRTGGDAVTMRTPTPPHHGGFGEAEADLESLPSNLLITATNNTEVEEAVNAVKQRNSTTPPLPTRGVMTRNSEPPHSSKVSANLPRASLTRDGESEAAGLAPRITDAPKPPMPHRTLADGADSLSPDDVKSETDSSAPDASGPETPRYNTPIASVQIRADADQVYSADLQKTRPPRARREPLIESGTPPPLGELSEVASRLARNAQSQPPVLAPLSEPEPKSSNGRTIGWLLFGVAAVAGAFTLGKRSSDPMEAPSTSVDVATSGSLAAVNTSALDSSLSVETSAAPEVSVAASESGPATNATPPLAAKTPAPSPPAVAKGVIPTPVRPTGVKPTAAANGVAATPSTGPAPAASTEAAAASTPGAFDSTAAANALALAANKASSCRQPGDPSGIARVTVTFTNSGKSTHALVDGPPFAGTATGGCIAATMRSTAVPPFTGDRVTVKKTVVIQ